MVEPFLWVALPLRTSSWSAWDPKIRSVFSHTRSLLVLSAPSIAGHNNNNNEQSSSNISSGGPYST